MRQRQGFTVIEVVLVTAVLGVLIFAVASLRGNLATVNTLVSQKLQNRQDIDRAIDQMVTEIRSAAPSSQGAYPIVTASTGTLIFYSDVDSDGLFERIRYSVVSSTLVRGVTKPAGSPLAYDTANEKTATLVAALTRTTSTPVFEYFGSDYTGTQQPLASTSTLASQVRVVRVQLFVDVRPREAPKPAYASALVSIRNLRDDD